MGNARLGAGTQETSVHHAAVALERLAGNAAHLDDAVEKPVDLGLGHGGAGCKDDVVGGINDLGLVPGVGLELRPESGIGDEEKAVGLKPEGGGGEDEGLLEGLPSGGRDFLGGVEGLGGVAPIQGIEKLGVGDGVTHENDLRKRGRPRRASSQARGAR